MKITTLLCRLTWVLTLLSVGARAATYYVATTGSDANPGTSAQPFRTLTYAYSLAGPGTTILVGPGTYTDYISGWGLHLYANGTAANPIVLQSQVAGGAIVDGQFASDRHDGIYLDGSYNVIEGFVITRAPITGIYVAGNANQILDDEISNNGTQGASDPEGQGVYSVENSSGNVYEGNYIHDNGYAGSNLDHGLYLCGQDELVANNVVIRQPSRGLQIAGYTTVSGMQVYNNVFAYNGADGITVWMAMNGVDIRNNICFANGRDGVEFYAATGSGVTVDHNLVYGNGYGNYSFSDGGSTASYTLGTTVSADPQLPNETRSGFDAHLASGSPAIGAGVNLHSTITTDIAGTPRPASGAWDMGAYVYASGASGSGGVTPPTVTLISPASGGSYSAPATIHLEASVIANGHTITAVRYDNAGRQVGESTVAPYAVTWGSLAAGMYGVNATAVYDAGSTVTSPLVTVTVTNPVASSGLNFAASSGFVTAPFFVTNNNAIVQPAYTGVTAGGQAVYAFNLSAAGHYVVSALVNAPSLNNNSFFVNLDAQPTDPTMVWDIPVTTGFASRTVSWRGNGVVSSTSASGVTAQYTPKVFNLSAGTHRLIVRGREGLSQLGTITIASTSLPSN